MIIVKREAAAPLIVSGDGIGIGDISDKCLFSINQPTGKNYNGQALGSGIKPAHEKLRGSSIGGAYLRSFLSLPVFFLSGCAVVSSLHLPFAYFFLCSCDASLIISALIVQHFPE